MDSAQAGSPRHSRQKQIPGSLIAVAETTQPLIRVFNAEQMALTPDKQLIVDRSWSCVDSFIK